MCKRTIIVPVLIEKKIPEPTRSMTASEKFPIMGIFAYQLKLVGKSHRKSETGMMNEKILFMDSMICFIALSFDKMVF